MSLARLHSTATLLFSFGPNSVRRLCLPHADLQSRHSPPPLKSASQTLPHHYLGLKWGMKSDRYKAQNGALRNGNGYLTPSTRLRTAQGIETSTRDGLPPRSLPPRSGFRQARSHFGTHFKTHWQRPRSCQPSSRENRLHSF